MTKLIILPIGLLVLTLIFLGFSNKIDFKKYTLTTYSRILLTNWINYIGLYVSFSLATLINNFIDHGKNVSYTKASTFEILLAAPLIFTIYGIGYIGLAILCIFTTDILALKLKLRNIYSLTLGQWLIASALLTYLAIIDWDAVFATTIISLTLVTQILRTKKLKYLIDTDNNQPNKHL